MSHPYLLSVTVETESQKSGSQKGFFKSSRCPKLNREGQLKKKKTNLQPLHFKFKVEKILCSTILKSTSNVYGLVKCLGNVNLEEKKNIQEQKLKHLIVKINMGQEILKRILSNRKFETVNTPHLRQLKLLERTVIYSRTEQPILFLMWPKQ